MLRPLFLLFVGALVCAQASPARAGKTRKAGESSKSERADTAPISCETAIGANVDDASATGPRDLSSSAYAEVLDRGDYLSACNVPSDMELRLCVAVRDGQAVGITVTATPDAPETVACVRDQLASLSFPSHPKMDVVRTTFAPQQDAPKSDAPYVPRFAEGPPKETPKSGGCACSTPADETRRGLGGWSLAIGLVGLLAQRRRTGRPRRPKSASADFA